MDVQSTGTSEPPESGISARMEVLLEIRNGWDDEGTINLRNLKQLAPNILTASPMIASYKRVHTHEDSTGLSY